MSTTDSSKTGSRFDKKLAETRKKLDEDLVFGKSPHLGVPNRFDPGEKTKENIIGMFKDEWKWEFGGEPMLTKEQIEKVSKKGKKESDGKTTFNEIDWDFIEDISNRMDANIKYPPLNYQKGMDVKELAKATLRHCIKILQPIPGDPETIKDHIEAIGSNAMMMNYQVKKKS